MSNNLKEKLILTDEETRLIHAWRKIKKDEDLQPKNVIEEIPKLQNAIFHNWGDTEDHIGQYKNGFYTIWLWHQLCYEILFGTPPNPALKKWKGEQIEEVE